MVSHELRTHPTSILHGGAVDGFSPGLNKGGTFVVALPVKPGTAISDESPKRADGGGVKSPWLVQFSNKCRMTGTRSQANDS